MVRQADLSKLHPLFRQRVESILRDLRQLGWQPVVAEGVRSREQQLEKVNKGYSKTMQSWHVPGTAKAAWRAGNSYDVVVGGAADIVDQRFGWHGPAANLEFQFWKDLGKVAKQHGCSWGGDWNSFKDVAHIEMNWVEMAPQKTIVV